MTTVLLHYCVCGVLTQRSDGVYWYLMTIGAEYPRSVNGLTVAAKHTSDKMVYDDTRVVG